jgi:hypothetical protein
LGLDLNRHLVMRGLHLAEDLGNSSAKPDVIVLDQDSIIETRAMVGASARPHGVLFERPERGGRLARIEHGYRAAGRVDVASRHRRDP